MERNSRRKVPDIPVFWLFFLLFLAVMLCFWAWIAVYVKNAMVTYEKAQSQPDRLMEGVLESFRSGEATSSLDFETGRFEQSADVRAAFTEALGTDLTYRQVQKGFDTAALRYEVISGGIKVADVTLREKSSREILLLLTLQEWELGAVEPRLGTMEPYTFVVPDSYTVTVNGVPLSETERVDEPTELELLKPVSEFVSVYSPLPKLVQYRVEGLFQEPEIQVLDWKGNPVSVTPSEGRTYRVDAFPTESMPADLQSYVLKNGKDFSNFQTKDLPGKGTKPIEHMFPKNSEYLALAEQYRENDMWMISNHETPTFSEEEVLNYTVYSDTLFSCEVKFTKSMKLTRTGELVVQHIHERVYYVLVDGQWLIADMRSVLS